MLKDTGWIRERTAVLTGDNAWAPEELDRLIRWDALSERLAGTALIVATHWNTPGLGAVSSTESWVAYVAARLPNRVLGNTNHVHRNAVESPHVTSSGQNGMRDWGSPARDCRGSQCCPTLWSGAWKLGGWSRGQLCGDLFGATAQVEAVNGSHDVVYTHAPPFLSDPVLAAVRSTRLYAMGASPLRTGGMPPYINLSEYVQVYGIRDGFPHCDNLAMMDIPFQVGYSCWTTESHPGDVLVFPEGGLLSR